MSDIAIGRLEETKEARKSASPRTQQPTPGNSVPIQRQSKRSDTHLRPILSAFTPVPLKFPPISTRSSSPSSPTFLSLRIPYSDPLHLLSILVPSEFPPLLNRSSSPTAPPTQSLLYPHKLLLALLSSLPPPVNPTSIHYLFRTRAFSPGVIQGVPFSRRITYAFS